MSIRISEGTYQFHYTWLYSGVFCLSERLANLGDMESPRRYDTPRRETRYALQLPVTVSVESEQPRQIKAQSDNISLSGILFSADSPIPLGVQVNVEVSISAVTGQGDASLASVGKIIRVTQPKAGEYKMAVGCERPFQFVGQETWKPS